MAVGRGLGWRELSVSQMLTPGGGCNPMQASDFNKVVCGMPAQKCNIVGDGENDWGEGVVL